MPSIRSSTATRKISPKSWHEHVSLLFKTLLCGCWFISLYSFRSSFKLLTWLHVCSRLAFFFRLTLLHSCSLLYSQIKLPLFLWWVMFPLAPCGFFIDKKSPKTHPLPRLHLGAPARYVDMISPVMLLGPLYSHPLDCKQSVPCSPANTQHLTCSSFHMFQMQFYISLSNSLFICLQQQFMS